MGIYFIFVGALVTPGVMIATLVAGLAAEDAGATLPPMPVVGSALAFGLVVAVVLTLTGVGMFVGKPWGWRLAVAVMSFYITRQVLAISTGLALGEEAAVLGVVQASVRGTVTFAALCLLSRAKSTEHFGVGRRSRVKEVAFGSVLGIAIAVAVALASFIVLAVFAGSEA